MRRTVAITVAAISLLAAAWMWEHSMNPTPAMAVKATSSPQAPLELMRDADRNLSVEPQRDAF
jgi:hypothetical protein